MAIQILEEVEVCVIGAGAGGPALAKHLVDAGSSVVLLEAGRKFNPDTDFRDLPLEMLISKFAWPLEHKATPFMMDDDGQPIMSNGLPVPNRFGLLNIAWGVGGTTLMYLGNHPRAHYYALDEWPALPGGCQWRDDLAQYYGYLEKYLPVPNAPMGYGPFDTNNAMTLVGAKNYIGLEAGDSDEAPSTPSSIPMYDPNQYDPSNPSELGGYRGQPNNMTTNCWHCGNCSVGCHKPQEAQLKDKVKRATNASFVPQGEKAGLIVRDKSFAIAILHPSLPDGAAQSNPYFQALEQIVGVLPHLVVYGTYSLDATGLPARNQQGQLIIENVFIQPAYIAVLAAGTVESPRLWLQSNWLLQNSPLFVQSAQQLLGGYEAGLPPDVQGVLSQFGGLMACYVHSMGGSPYTLPQNDNVGRNFMTHNENFILGIYDKPIKMWIGQNSQARVDLPHLGMIESLGVPPCLLANAAFAKDVVLNPQTGEPMPDPVYAGYYDHPLPKFGVMAKAVQENYANGKLLVAFTEDDPLPYNRVYLDSAKREKFYVNDLQSALEIPVTAIQYHPSDGAKERSRKVTKMAMEMMEHVQDTSEVHLVGLYNLNMELNSIFHSMGTMSMGLVVNTDGEAIDGSGNLVPRLFVADACVLPNSLGGPNPVHTIQALALRTAEAMARKYLLSTLQWNKWKSKLGSESFIA